MQSSLKTFVCKYNKCKPVAINSQKFNKYIYVFYTLDTKKKKN